METLEHLISLGLFDARVPRYTSYPTAPVFSTDTDAGFQARCIEALDPKVPISVYLHIPFCERLCWFCACRTQGTTTLSPVLRYIETLEAELALLRGHLPAGVTMGRLHWGGGTPTILPPELIHRLARAIKQVIPPAPDFEFSVEIDPTMVDQAKITALKSEGMRRASIGIQDFNPKVQDAIGRAQPYDITAKCVEMLRAAGIQSLNTDLVYGLPYQTADMISDTVAKTLTLSPDRVALFGYAHVPWMAKRQQLIKDETLPDDAARHGMFTLASRLFSNAGLMPLGIDHFARADDSLSVAARDGRLRRNFQGYTDDTCQTLLGLGASSISRFQAGYVQNAAATGAYTQRIEAGQLAGHRGHEMTPDDLLRARAIEMLMCDFRLDQDQLAVDFGARAASLNLHHEHILRRFAPFVQRDALGLTIAPEGRPLTRIIAACYDAHKPQDARYSRAS